MRFLIQVVEEASIKVSHNDLKQLEFDTTTISNYMTQYWYEADIKNWLLIYVSVHTEDILYYKEKIAHFVSKIRGLQVFNKDGKLIGTLDECGWEILLIPNFTLYGKNRKWLRFDFTDSAPFADAKKIYEELVNALVDAGVSVRRGVFWWFMEISSLNAWPINFVMEV